MHSSVCSSCTTGLACRSGHLSTPAVTISTKIATLKGIFPARNPTEKRHQVSMVHFSGSRMAGKDLRALDHDSVAGVIVARRA